MEQSFLIIGAGIFGVSTALHLKRSNPSVTVTLVDRTPFPNPSAASHDLSKTIRSDYDDLFYMKLALEAHNMWRTDELFKPYYYETGMFFNVASHSTDTILKNYKALGFDSPAKLITQDEFRTRFNGLFSETDLTDVEQTMWQPQAGYGKADSALEAVTQAAIDLGVKYVAATVQKLSITEDGSCTGAITEDSVELNADHVVLCSGARTAKLLADSAPDKPELQANGRIMAVGSFTCCAKFPADEAYKLKDAPQIILTNHTHGEALPPTSTGLIKINNEVTFTNIVHHEASNQDISIPPTSVGQSTWGQEVPEGLKKEAKKILKNVYGDVIKGLEIESYRMCWDGFTRNQDWIIGPHPKCKNLFIATGGSFHAWKFFPNIGNYVVKMLNGELSEEASRRWAWDRSDEGAICYMYIPKRDLKDIEGYSELKK